MKVTDVLALAYNMELQGMRFYEDQKDKVKLPVVRELFSFLREMEQGHAAYLEKQIENVGAGKSLDSLPDSVEGDRYREIMSRQKVVAENLDSDLGDYSIMRMAYLIEKDFAEFYTRSSSESEGEVKDLFHTLAEWERGHAEMMKTEMGKIISRNALDLGFYPFSGE
jgi:rubrerythrin